MSRRPPFSRQRRRRLTITSAVAVLLLLAGGYTVAAATASPPELVPVTAPDFPTSHTTSLDEGQALVDAESLPTAISWKELDHTWVNDHEIRPLASISKLVTVLVCLEHEPLNSNPEEWPTHTWSEADAIQQQEYAEAGGVVFPVEIGTELPLHDMLTLILLPSANDMVTAYATRVFGSNEEFTQAVEAWAAEHDLPSLTLVEPSGMDERNVATLEDTVKLAHLALENEVITQFSSLASADVPGFGVVDNTNPLFATEDNVIGLKTGRTLSAGFNLIAAQATSVGERDLTKISVTLGRDSAEARAQAGAGTLAMLDTLPTQEELIAPDTVAATATTWADTTVSFSTQVGTHAWLLPGESATLDLSLDPPPTFEAGDPVGELRITLPTGERNIPIVADETVEAPDLWWNMAHPMHILNAFR